MKPLTFLVEGVSDEIYLIKCSVNGKCKCTCRSGTIIISKSPVGLKLEKKIINL